jgi:hypothetical protein
VLNGGAPGDYEFPILICVEYGDGMLSVQNAIGQNIDNSHRGDFGADCPGTERHRQHGLRHRSDRRDHQAAKRYRPLVSQNDNQSMSPKSAPHSTKLAVIRRTNFE